MASLSKADSKRMYSWWWNSHISPKNSKWLQENLADVDIKVKAMIRLIEEDADSFARRAEMYYKKRPELMKLVEELYRAYRALAERYDHATGALRQAHKTMSEAFPNQVPAGCDDSVSNSPYESDPQTPDTKSITSFDPVDLQKDGSNGSYGSMGTARKALSFSDSGDGNDKHRPHDQNVSQLKEALAKIEDEKEAGMKQYLESLDKLSKLESEMLKYQENSRELAERATNAEAETHEMKQMLQKLEVDKEESLERYREVQKKLDEINEQNLKEEIERLKEERDAAYDQYKQLIDLQTDLENKLLEAEKEIERLKVEIVKLTKEKDAQTVLYQQCMETISSLELRLVCAEEETEQLKTEIENGISLLKGAEEQRVMLEKSNKSLHLELESMGVKIGVQSQEITEKQKELGRLWTCIQEERLRFVEAETAFQTLQQLHAQSQEELRSMAGELQNRAQVLRDIETHNRVLEEEIRMKIEENKNLNELSLSSAISLKEMQTEINFLKESNGKLEEEVDLRVDQRNALQQEIYCLKEELNGLNEKHKSVLEQVAYVGLNPESLGLSVKELRDQKSNLESEWEKEKAAKATLLVKLEVMNQLLERNVVLENSLSDLGAELEGVRGKLKLLEEAYQSLLDEKSNLVVEKANLLGQLQVTTDNLSHVSENNTVLENSLFDAHVKLEVLKQKSKSFEDSCQLLADEKSVLITEKGTLVSQMEVTEKQLNEMKMKYTDLEEKYSLLRSQIQLMQTESQNKIKEFEHELDKSFDSEIKILILMKCVQDFQEAYKLSESLIHVLKQEKTETAIKIKSLTDENNGLKNGMHQLLKAAGLSLHPACENGLEQTWVDNIRENIEGINRALSENEDRNTEMVVEITILLTLLTQFKTKLADLEAEKLVTEHELRARDEKLHGLQNEAREISETNEELRSKVTEAGVTESGLRTQLENLQCELSVLQEASRTLEMENSAVIEDKKSLLKDNIHIKNQIRVLEESIDNIFGKVLSQDIFSQTLKNHIHEKHGELSLVEKKLEDVTEENLDLKKSIADLQRENNEATVTKHQQGKQILQLLEENDNLSQENQILNINLQESRENQEKTEEKSRVLETEGSLIYGDLQASVVYQVLLEEKISELTEVCLNLQDENDSKDLNTGLLEERSNVLECENADLKARLDAYGPALESLKNSIVSLENQTCVRTKVQQPENENQKIFQDGEPVTLEQDPYLELQGLQSKVKAIETAVAEMQMLSMQQKLDSDAKLESAMIQIEELIQQNVSRKTNGKLKSTPEISESDPKDIMLDQASECSSYGVSKRGLTEGEIWETADDSKFISSHHPTASDVSLDNFMDKLELSRRFKEPREDGTKRKVLERLNSDVLKLTNLQITIEDLKRKVEITSKSRRGKAMIECETLKGQLMEAESSIQKLYELNARLVKHIKGNTEKEKSSTTSGSGESESMRRRKVGEQARRVSEKIGRLQLEIQKIQFVLVKLDDETEPGGKRRFLDTKKRVLLKDYLYGGGKPKATISSSGRRKKNHFCACVEPSTKGD